MIKKTYPIHRIQSLWLTLFLSIAAVVAPAAAGTTEGPVKTVRMEGSFEDIRDSVKSSIEGKGINIAHTLPAGEMLNKTAADFGIETNVFLQAETVEFCSARISHQLAQANHENIMLCPFTISVYVLKDEPGYVYLSYRRPFTFDDERSQAAVNEVVSLIESIIDEVTAW